MLPLSQLRTARLLFHSGVGRSAIGEVVYDSAEAAHLEPISGCVNLNARVERALFCEFRVRNDQENTC